eukprot:4209046-Heterocapsa_arctica.AAC.1
MLVGATQAIASVSSLAIGTAMAPDWGHRCHRQEVCLALLAFERVLDELPEAEDQVRRDGLVAGPLGPEDDISQGRTLPELSAKKTCMRAIPAEDLVRAGDLLAFSWDQMGLARQPI